MASESVSHGGALPYNWMIENTIAPVTNADGSPGLLQVLRHTMSSPGNPVHEPQFALSCGRNVFSKRCCYAARRHPVHCACPGNRPPVAHPAPKQPRVLDTRSILARSRIRDPRRANHSGVAADSLCCGCSCSGLRKASQCSRAALATAASTGASRRRRRSPTPTARRVH